MNERLLTLLDDVERARVELMQSLGRLGEALRDRHAVTEPGFVLSEQDLVPGVELHEDLIRGLERMHHTLALARAETVRVMVDEEGLTLSDVAKMVGRPRQLVSRLYRSASASGA